MLFNIYFLAQQSCFWVGIAMGNSNVISFNLFWALKTKSTLIYIHIKRGFCKRCEMIWYGVMWCDVMRWYNTKHTMACCRTPRIFRSFNTSKCFITITAIKRVKGRRHMQKSAPMRWDDRVNDDGGSHSRQRIEKEKKTRLNAQKHENRKWKLQNIISASVICAIWKLSHAKISHIHCLFCTVLYCTERWSICIWMTMSFEAHVNTQIGTHILIFTFFFFIYFLLMHMKVLILIQCVEKLNQLHIYKHHSSLRTAMNRQIRTHAITMMCHIERARFFYLYAYKSPTYSHFKFVYFHNKKRHRSIAKKYNVNTESSDDLAFKSIFICHECDKNYLIGLVCFVLFVA